MLLSFLPTLTSITLSNHEYVETFTFKEYEFEIIHCLDEGNDIYFMVMNCMLIEGE